MELDSFVALAHDGKHLYEPYKHHLYLYLPDSPHYELDIGRFATHAG